MEEYIVFRWNRKDIAPQHRISSMISKELVTNASLAEFERKWDMKVVGVVKSIEACLALKRLIQS